MLTKKQIIIKRTFDIVCSILGIALFSPVILLFVLLSSIVFKANGFFIQDRIGQYGKPFKIFKIRSLSITNKRKVNFFGNFLRNSKIDELPQLFNVFIGNMSLVGPRPDVKGFADELKGEDRTVILSVKPGITGIATIFFRDEEKLLIKQKDPEEYNKKIIWPQKVALNSKYVKEYSFYKDVYYIYKTVFKGL